MSYADTLFRPGVTAGIAVCLLAVAAATGLDLGQDFQRQSAARHRQWQKQQLALSGELELGHAVQDFKDCLLRAEPTYCEDFRGHIEALDRNLTLYSAQHLEHPAERETLEALHRSLPAYELALDEVRDMQSRHATVQEIDSMVRGADRPLAEELRALASLSSRTSPQWTLPIGPTLLLMSCAALAGYFIFLTLRSSRPWDSQPWERTRSSARALRPLLERVMDWEERGRARAYARLHDEVCQSLAAAMYHLESLQPGTLQPGGLQPAGLQPAAVGTSTALGDGAPERLPATVVPALRTAIQSARSVAMQLRPARRPEAGVLASLHSLWTDTRVLNPRWTVESFTPVHEGEIPRQLQPVIVRTAQMIAEFAAEESVSFHLFWALERRGDELRLSLELCSRPPHEGGSRSAERVLDNARELFETIAARVVLSGGQSELGRYTANSHTIVCTWLCDPLQS